MLVMDEGFAIDVSLTGILRYSPLALMNFGQNDAYFTFGCVTHKTRSCALVYLVTLTNSCTPEPKSWECKSGRDGG
jgi:hypothetical protein